MEAPESPEFDSFLEDVRIVVAEIDRLVSAYTNDVKWRAAEGFLPLVRRAVLRRQHDCLASMVELCGKKMGYGAVSLLRPAYEELIWVKYLAMIPNTTAERLIRNLLALEVFELLKAQADDAGPDVMSQLHLDGSYSRFSQLAPHARKELKAIGQELGWPGRRNPIRTMRYLAQKVGMASTYSFLYHASSRFVHFNTVELVRRAWGRPGLISLSSSTFEPYWSRFALAWGVDLYTQVLLEVVPGLEDNPEGEVKFDAPRTLEAFKRIQESGKVPIVTAEELHWPETE